MKKISLKNGIVANINVSLDDSTNSIHALDEDGKLVGFCYFKIFHSYSRSVNDTFRKAYAKKYNIPLEDTPKTYSFKINVNEKDNYSINDNTLTLSNGKSYDFNFTFCEIGEIEIVDERYYKVGLGSAMLKEIEAVAKNLSCKLIKGKYLPKGDFQFGTCEFYKRNGFVFEKENNETFIVKALEKNMVIQPD